MGLLSAGFLAALAVVVLVATVGTTLAWPRLSGGGAAAYAGRLALVLTCQLLAVALTATALNRYFDFYASWGELIPRTTVATPVTTPTLVTPPGVVTTHGRTATPPTPAPQPAAYVGVPDPRPGRLVPITVPGTGGLSEQGYAFLPPQYDEAAHRGERFPAVLVLAGYPGHVVTLLNRLQVPGTMDRLLADGTGRPMVMVLLSPTVAPPRDTECADVPGGPSVETYLAKDVPTWVNTHFRTSGDWAVLGASTGGFCALKLATRHPQVFSSAVSLSGYVHPLEDSTTGELYGHDPALRAHSDPIWLLRHGPAPRVSYLLTASRTESEVYPQVQEFVSVVRPPASVSTIVLASGGHNFGVWLSELPTALRWLSARLPPPGRG